MNMEENNVRKSAAGLARKRLGTKAHCMTNSERCTDSWLNLFWLMSIKVDRKIASKETIMVSKPNG